MPRLFKVGVLITLTTILLQQQHKIVLTIPHSAFIRRNPSFKNPQLNYIIAEKINVKAVCLKEVPETHSVVLPVKPKCYIELISLQDLWV